MINSFSGRYRFLSNFYPCEINHEGIKYPSVEHFYVAMKVKNDQMVNGQFVPWIDCREYIAKIETAGKAKRFGRTLSVRKDWDQVKLGYMSWAVREKFSNNEELKEMLISTGSEELIEGNHWNDTFWGICNGKGENHLGKILMQVRSEIKNNTIFKGIQI